MGKHKLFTQIDCDSRFSCSLNESMQSGGEQRSKASKITFEPGVKKARGFMMGKDFTHYEEAHPSASVAVIKNIIIKEEKECDINIQSTSSNIENDFDSDSEWDTRSVQIFSCRNQKLPYSHEEDVEILKYVLHGDSIFRVGSISLWKELEYKKNPRRTYQSLKNRFLRNIQPHLFTTYRYLIKDEGTVRKILLKFPELKKQVGKKQTLPRIELPQRVLNSKVSEARLRSTNLQENEVVKSTLAAEQEQIPEPAVQSSAEASNSNHVGDLSIPRRVNFSGDSLTVVVNLNFKERPLRSLGIYEKFEKLKSRNKVIPCSMCGRGGFGEGGESLSSDAESDAFICNSVDSKRLRQDPRTVRVSGSVKKKKSNSSPESCSLSLLDDVNAMGELDGNESQNEGVSNCVDAAEEKDLSPGVRESSGVDQDTDGFYESAVEEFRKFIDSDEEEMLFKKFLKKNLKRIGFEDNLSVDAAGVDSFFFKSSSVDFGSDDNTSSQRLTESASGSSLVRNMMNMMKEQGRTQKEV